LVYQKSVEFSISVIDIIDDLRTPRKHYRLIEQLEASCTSIALNIAEGKGRFSKKRVYTGKLMKLTRCFPVLLVLFE